jgi:hypothetical protein
MTRSQSAVLHDALRKTESAYDARTGLPTCTDNEIAQRIGIIAAHEIAHKQRARRLRHGAIRN